jgi:alpha-L-fucosidase
VTRRSFVLSASVGAALPRIADAAAGPPASYGTLPSARQLRWHELETYSFLHFTVNTFTDREWGNGDEDPSLFNPTDFYADSIIAALHAGGMKGVILTAKHHDGFCLWPTRTTDHSVRQSSWRGGKGDVVREIADAARRHGLKFGVYVSPWDRNNARYGRPEYVTTYREQLRELLTGYGPIFEVWHDGANGGTGYYGGANEKRTIDKATYYGWPATWDLIRSLQPDAVIFSDVGPDIRWVGNEKGYANETCWETFDPVGADGGLASPGNVRAKESGTGTRQGSHWLPPECDVSIRPGWFWHAKENDRVKTPAQLADLYYQSVGRGASLLLNVPPDRRGLLGENDVVSLRAFGERLRATFGKNLAAGAKITASNVREKNKAFRAVNLLDGNPETYWATDDAVTTAEVLVEFRSPVSFNVIRLRENIRLGQRVDAFAIDTWRDGTWQEFGRATSIGPCRLVRAGEMWSTTRLRLRITESSACPAMSELGVFADRG